MLISLTLNKVPVKVKLSSGFILSVRRENPERFLCLHRAEPGPQPLSYPVALFCNKHTNVYFSSSWEKESWGNIGTTMFHLTDWKLVEDLLFWAQLPTIKKLRGPKKRLTSLKQALNSLPDWTHLAQTAVSKDPPHTHIHKKKKLEASFWGHLIREQKAELLWPHSKAAFIPLSPPFPSHWAASVRLKLIMHSEAYKGFKNSDNYKPITPSSIPSERQGEERELVVQTYLLKQFHAD